MTNAGTTIDRVEFSDITAPHVNIQCESRK